MVNPSQVVCFENHAEWRFCLAPFSVSRLVGAVALGWRSGARARCCFLPFFSPCVVHVRISVDVHLDSCDRTQAVSFKTVISTAPSSTGLSAQPLFVLILDAEIGEAAAAQQTPIPVDVNVPVVPELSLW